MARIEGVNISSALNKQLHAIGNSAAAAKQTLRKLAKGSGSRGTRLSGGESRVVCKKAGLTQLQLVFAAPYGDDGFQVFYYRTGSAEVTDAWLASHANRFRGREDDPHIWAIYLGKFDGDTFIEPQHDNSPDEEEAEEAPAGPFSPAVPQLV